ncbi:MAG: ion transporter [Gemmatimonadota bacterium]|nr:ion transporter [Gemmatimonadota bacterium]
MKSRIHEVIFEADTALGKSFDIALLAAIVLSVLAVVLESVPEIRAVYGPQLRTSEWIFTILFTVEYLLRLYSVSRPVAYATSFFGVVDLLAIIPTYLSIVFSGGQSLLVIRALRLLRVFRVLKLAQFVQESRQLWFALRASGRKIIVFLGSVLTIVLIVAALMYLIEGEENGFTSIPHGLYWAIVTLTTVGYGDLVPQTLAGRFLASIVMIMGYGIIAVPTGIVTVELAGAFRGAVSTQACPSCSREGHAPDAKYCKICGEKL